METLQARIAKALRESGLSQSELANRVGVSRATVSLWVNGPTQTIEGENLTRAARALNVNAHWLITGENESRQRQIGVSEPEASYLFSEESLLDKFRQLGKIDKTRIISIIDVLIATKGR